jgi:carbonic anhydrase
MGRPFACWIAAAGAVAIVAASCTPSATPATLIELDAATTAPVEPVASTAEPTAVPTAEPDAAPTAEHEGPHWSYEGEAGPDAWAQLSEGFGACGTGSAQSPIDLTGAQAQGLANIAFHYVPSRLTILNNGHTVQVNYDPGSYIQLDGVRYDLVQFHFHAPAEHSVDGALADAELHLVHRAADKRLAVVGVLIQEGASNAALDPVLAAMPADETEPTSVAMTVMAADLLPAVQTTFRYAGSLTTPPCSEGVAWSVMTTPIEAAVEQIDMFQAIFEGNNRPVQPIGDRVLTEDSTP